MLAVAFGPPSMSRALEELPRAAAVADCVELRLDLIGDGFDLPALLRARGQTPVVVTLRPPEQGGKCPLPAAERLRALLDAARGGAEYVDVEFDALTPAGLHELRARGAQVIVSRHDFSAMPPLEAWWAELAALDADVVKVVGSASDALDNLRVLRTLERADRPTIAIAMGAAGLASRVLALRYEACLLTYAAATDGAGTAPGQLTLDEMREVYCAARIGVATRVFGLLGAHDERARVQEYNAWFARDGVDAIAVPFQVSSGAAADAARIVAAYRELPVSGWHIHGEALQREVVPELDSAEPHEARVNAIVRQRDGALHGAWVESPAEQYALWCAFD